MLYHDELRRLGVMEQLHLAPSIYVAKSKFLNCRMENSTGQLTVCPLNPMFCPEYPLVSFSATDRGLASDGDIVVRRAGHARWLGGLGDGGHYMLIPEDLATLFAEVTNQDMEASKQAKFFVLLLLLVIVQLKMLIQFSNVEI